MTEALATLKTEILEDGIIDAEEVVKLEGVVFEDGVIDKDEISLLVDLADETDASQNAPEFEELYLKAVDSRYLQDEASPGAIDESEADEIIELFYGDGNLNSYEKAALAMIKEKATSIAPKLQEVIDLVC